MKIFILLFYFCILTSFNFFGQQTISKDRLNGNNWIVTCGYYRTQFNIAELTVGRGHSNNENIWVDLQNYTAGAEVVFDKNKALLCPKIAYEYSFLIFCFRANLLYMTDFNTGALIIRPEIGLSGLGYFNVNYTYNIDFVNKTSLVQTHGIHLQWNIFAGGRNFKHPE